MFIGVTILYSMILFSPATKHLEQLQFDMYCSRYLFQGCNFMYYILSSSCLVSDSLHFCGEERFVNISLPPWTPGFLGIAWQGALPVPSTPLELSERDPLPFGDRCAQQHSIAPGGLFARCEAIKARREFLEACRDWRPPWVTWWEPYRHPPGWPELYIDRHPLPPQRKC